MGVYFLAKVGMTVFECWRCFACQHADKLCFISTSDHTPPRRVR